MVYKFRHVQPCMKTRRRQVKLFSVSHKTELASCHNSCVILMTMLSCKLKNYIILLQFVILVECTINKKSHDPLVQFVNNSLIKPKGSCNFENCQNHSYLLITNCTRGRAISVPIHIPRLFFALILLINDAARS